MELVVSLINPEHRLMFELLAATGVRRSELIAFKVHDLSLNGKESYVKVRRRIRRRSGMGLVVGALKSRYAKRELPISIEVADRLRAHIAGRSRNDWVFASAAGAPLDPNNLANRVLAPACEEAAVEWAASTPSATPSRHDSSPKGATSSRSNAGSDTTPRASRSTPTSTCSTRISGGPSSRSGSRKNQAKVRKTPQARQSPHPRKWRVSGANTREPQSAAL